MGNTAFDNSGLLQQAPAGSSGFNQEVRNTGQGLVLPVPIAHVGSGSLTGNSSSYLAGRARCKVQTTEEKMTSLRSDLLPRLCTLSGLLSHQQELISKSSILSNMLLRKSYWQEGAVRRAQSWKASLTTCRSLLLVCGPSSTESGDKHRRRPRETGAEVAVPLAGLDLLKGVKGPTLPLQDSVPKGASLPPGTE